MDCMSLTTAPELPATTLVSRCYCNMFYRCIWLTTVPELRATTLAEGCYQYMFSGCVNLNSIAMFATDISAYEVAQSNGFTGTETEWLASLKGDKGDQGIQGPTGNTGLSAYQIAVEAGYTGTETEWLESLKGTQGPQGKSAYDIYKEYQIATGNTYLNESDWNNKLANIQVYSAGSGINISEEGVISSTIDISGNAIWYEETE